MAKRKAEVRLRSYGVYTKWDSDAKLLPKVIEITTRVRAQVDVEFGFVVNIKGAKNQLLHYSIDHPGVLDDNGEIRPPFDGEVYVRTNDWSFFLGDTIWEPISDKLGTWRMSLVLNGETIADKSFELV
jgi:hypothetical protein